MPKQEKESDQSWMEYVTWARCCKHGGGKSVKCEWKENIYIYFFTFTLHAFSTYLASATVGAPHP